MRDNIQKMVMGHGSETEKYPLEVLFKWPGPCHDASAMCPESVIKPFAIGIATGSAVTMASHLLRRAVMLLGLLEQTPRPAHQQILGNMTMIQLNNSNDSFWQGSQSVTKAHT